jgi:20S proteasome subunit alpha 3
VSKLLVPSKSSEKMYVIDGHVAVAVAGITSDANILIEKMRRTSGGYRFTYQEPMPVEQLVRATCNVKQGYTQHGGLRPFGVSFLFAGWDKHYGFQLYQSDPSGNYGGWKATAIGNNYQAAQGILKQEYKEEEIDVPGALQLAVNVLAKSMDSTSLSSERLDLSTLSLDDDGNVVFRQLQVTEVDDLVEAYQAKVAAEEAEKKAKADKAAAEKRAARKAAAQGGSGSNA